jgi:hypothetical protein
MKITSAALMWLGWLSAAEAQTAPAKDGSIITPTFVPAPLRPAGDAMPARFAEPNPVPPAAKASPTAAQGQDKLGAKARADADKDFFINLPLDLPGPQGLFGRRESEAAFYSRIGQAAPRSQPAVFPAEMPVSKERYKPREFARSVAQVEPLFVMHQRLLFEQPNFERGLYDLGIIQPVVNLGVFYYDLALMPYHYWSNMRDCSESNVGKCLPGDQAPFRVPIERFSVTGVIGELGVIIAGGYLFP